MISYVPGNFNSIEFATSLPFIVVTTSSFDPSSDTVIMNPPLKVI